MMNVEAPDIIYWNDGEIDLFSTGGTNTVEYVRKYHTENLEERHKIDCEYIEQQRKINQQLLEACEGSLIMMKTVHDAISKLPIDTFGSASNDVGMVWAIRDEILEHLGKHIHKNEAAIRAAEEGECAE